MHVRHPRFDRNIRQFAHAAPHGALGSTYRAAAREPPGSGGALNENPSTVHAGDDYSGYDTAPCGASASFCGREHGHATVRDGSLKWAAAEGEAVDVEQ